MRLLFFHGAGGFDEDRGLAEGLGSALRASVDYPRLPDQDMSYAAWSATVGAGLGRVERGDVIVGHSFGASILLKVLAQEQSPPRAAVLLAMPDWSPSGWGVPDYQFEGPEPASSISLHHCTDDDVVPFEHLALHAARLPSAQIHEHQAGGHQFEGLIETLAASIIGRE
ncbi:alpha/beta hydrolase [Ornithinimicrobium faecis]|uniref:alpha/beta hydrolase n=1 Tax=Ornithinimicrobium faecis TaxID=2934158 RepID=UPI00211855D7|nr:alpha/beta hydrolase [Ornithinimicrobium sp. HY1745]